MSFDFVSTYRKQLSAHSEQNHAVYFAFFTRKDKERAILYEEFGRTLKKSGFIFIKFDNFSFSFIDEKYFLFVYFKDILFE